jgi:cyclopropane fatty-acyl-phospholipid synthase-like methyltransferase
MIDNRQVTQDFLDSSQYLESSILQYERVYGEDFVSPGGREMAREMIGRMALAPDARVLDVGCGLGGSAFVMASEFGLQVDGIDLSRNMLALANQKLSANGLSRSVNLHAWNWIAVIPMMQFTAGTCSYISMIKPGCFQC